MLEQTTKLDTTRTDRLAAYAATFRYEQLPDEAVAATKAIVLDTIGAMLVGSLPRYTASAHVAELARTLGGPPECTVIGRDFKSSVANAALANGVLGYMADIEGGGAAAQHTAAVLVPTALTVGERERVDGRALIAGIALGYDVSSRLALTANTRGRERYPYHPTAIWGHFGAATVAGHFLGLDSARFANALGLAGINSGGMFVWLNDPSEDSRPYVVGMAAHCGTMAAYLARAGMGGPLGIADHDRWSIYDAFGGLQGPELTEVTRDLGEVFWVTRALTFKRHPCCANIHCGIDALIDILTEHDLRPEEIESIDHRISPGYERGIYNNPLKSHNGQYIMAVVGVHREVPFDAISVDYRQTDPRVAALAQRIHLRADPAIGPNGLGAAIVEVRTRDGREFRRAVTYFRGHAENPLSPAELEERFFRLATTRLACRVAEEVHEICTNLEQLDEVARLTGLLSVSGAV